MHKPPLDILKHYGTKRHSGRYPWGSGSDPNQHSRMFMEEIRKMKSEGLSEKEIAAKFEMNTTQLRNNITWAKADVIKYNTAKSKELFETGMSKVAIAKELGISEGTVRDYLSGKSPAEKVKKVQLDNVSKALKDGVDNTGYLDVGVGVERQLGVSRTKFNAMVNKLVEDEGYHIHEVHVQRLSDKAGDKWTTVKVLTKNPDVTETRKNSHNIRPLNSWSEDGGMSLTNTYKPHMLNLDRIKVRYKEDGGADKDGLIELRRGVDDLDLGKSKYAQVRIGAGDDLYLKGMAAYSDDSNFPKGVDIIFNTNKGKGTPVEKVLKKTAMHPNETDDPSALFGSSVVRQKGALNIVNEQGDWDTWSTKMSSQFLSKQPTTLIKDRLDDTYASLRKEFDEINSMTNPVVKKYLMEKYEEGLDSKAKHLKAKGLAGTKSHVLLPFPDIKPNEIYAPNFQNGERVVLVRHPHGGIFEIPELVVNNRFKAGIDMIGPKAPDAVGIHPSMAEKLSGADFDGDTALVIPNNNGAIKTKRSLKELKNFDPKMYQVDHQTISSSLKQTKMGEVSNLITDMTVKGASDSEIARAVKHSMVVIDSEKHRLDYKQSAIDNGISALVNKWQKGTNPETGKVSRGASTLISRSKSKIDLSQHETAKTLYADKIDKTGKVLKKGLTTAEIAKKLGISEDTVKGYVHEGKEFNPSKYSSGTAREELYINYINGVAQTKKDARKALDSIKAPQYSKEAAKLYADEVKSLNNKLNTALLNAPRERQAQLLTNKLFYDNVKKGMDKEAVEKLKSRSLAKARTTVGAKKEQIVITPKEWEAIQAKAISNTKLLEILKNANMDVVRKLATPRVNKLSSSSQARAQLLLNKGYTFAEVASQMGVSPSALRDELGITKQKGVKEDD